jgi:hypothetical protein
MSKFVLMIALIALCMVQAAWLGRFALELLFDTSRTTAMERWRSIRHYLFFLLIVQVGITIIAILLVFNEAPLSPVPLTLGSPQ